MTNRLNILIFSISLLIAGIGNAKDIELDTYLSMKLTHTIYKAVIYTHIEDIDKSYKPFYLAHKYYLLNFLSKWEKMINSGKFESNDQIFNKIRNGKTFLSKYYYIWYGIHSVTPKTQIALGGKNNVFLKKVYNIDKSNFAVEDKILNYLDAANLYLISNSNDHRAAGYLATAFQESEIQSIKKKAKSLLSNASFQNKLEIANIALLVAGFGARALSKPINLTLSKAQSLFKTVSSKSTILATKSLNTLKNVKSIYHTTAISSAL